MAQRWHELLFAHWPIPAESIRAIVPPPLEVDLFDGQAWLGVIPFRMTGVRPRLLPPVGPISAFPELNVRTYVVVGGKPGVYFFSLDAASRVAVWAAKTFFALPYFHARMASMRSGVSVDYRSERSGERADLRVTYGPVGPAWSPARGTLDHWLTERYALYTTTADGTVLRGNIHHAPWRLQQAEAEFAVNSVATPVGIRLPRTEPVLHYAELQDVRIWLPRRAGPRAERRAHRGDADQRVAGTTR
jgi:uncharacterized protein YqjF (DUF2071 family)